MRAGWGSVVAVALVIIAQVCLEQGSGSKFREPDPDPTFNKIPKSDTDHRQKKRIRPLEKKKRIWIRSLGKKTVPDLREKKPIRIRPLINKLDPDSTSEKLPESDPTLKKPGSGSF